MQQKDMSGKLPMGIAYPPRPLAEPRSGRYAGCKRVASEVFGCIPHARGAYAAARNENYCGNLLWQSSVTLLARIKEDRYEEGTRAKC